MTQDELISLLEDKETQNLLGNMLVFQDLFHKAEQSVLEKYVAPVLKDFAEARKLIFTSEKLASSFKFYFYKKNWDNFRIVFCIENKKMPVIFNNNQFSPRNIFGYGVKSFATETNVFSRKEKYIRRVLEASFPTATNNFVIWEALPVYDFMPIYKENSEKISSFIAEKADAIVTALEKV